MHPIQGVVKSGSMHTTSIYLQKCAVISTNNKRPYTACMEWSIPVGIEWARRLYHSQSASPFPCVVLGHDHFQASGTWLDKMEEVKHRYNLQAISTDLWASPPVGRNWVTSCRWSSWIFGSHMMVKLQQHCEAQQRSRTQAADHRQYGSPIVTRECVTNWGHTHTELLGNVIQYMLNLKEPRPYI